MSNRYSVALIVCMCIVLAPAQTHAASAVKKVVAPKIAPIEISGWIPYWRTATGTADVIPNIKKLNTVEPFGFTVKSDGTLYDAMGIMATGTTQWSALISAARANKVKIIPTIMWGSGPAIDATLRNKTSRIAHINAIVAAVKAGGFDGIDIDYESKLAETRPYFSLFLKELYAKMGKKLVYCCIESRTPPADAFDKIPKNLEYANDFVAINKYCDRVNIMTYDQGTIDLRLNAGANGAPYIPVADPKWVEKVITLASKTISKKKIMIGIATYGYEYKVTPLSEQGYRYDMQWAFNPRYALELAQTFGVTPHRTISGEMSFTYLPTIMSQPAPVYAAQNAIPMSGQLAAVAAVSYSGNATAPVADAQPINIVWWSDAQAIQTKIALARKLGVRGVAIFKLDGGQDPNMWSILK